jgi:NADH-quinone oxidoreductase subunit L
LLSDLFYGLVDNVFIDGIVNRTARLTLIIGGQVRKIQSGYIGFYLMAMVLSMIAVFLYAFIIK